MLDLWLDGKLVASTVPMSRGRRFRIRYSDEIASTYAPEIPLLSCSIPTPGPGQPGNSHAFLEGLLPERGVRMSLAGAQDKLLLTRVGSRWSIPRNGAPSTHILKPERAWPGSARNEALVLNLAQACGLGSAPSWFECIGDSEVLVTE